MDFKQLRSFVEMCIRDRSPCPSSFGYTSQNPVSSTRTIRSISSAQTPSGVRKLPSQRTHVPHELDRLRGTGIVRAAMPAARQSRS